MMVQYFTVVPVSIEGREGQFFVAIFAQFLLKRTHGLLESNFGAIVSDFIRKNELLARSNVLRIIDVSGKMCFLISVRARMRVLR